MLGLVFPTPPIPPDALLAGTGVKVSAGDGLVAGKGTGVFAKIGRTPVAAIEASPACWMPSRLVSTYLGSFGFSV